MEEHCDLPAEIIAEAEEVTLQLLPKKSRDLYAKEFADFNVWREKRGVTIINEDVLLAYFLNLKNKFAPSSMWTKYSMLKANLKVYNNIDISSYGKVIAYLKSLSKTYKPKKSKVLERKQIEQFLKEADDEEYLMIKVAVIVGVSGGLRCNELTNLNIEDVEDKGKYLYITIPETKTNIPRSFTILEEGFSVNALEICKKYIGLRPKTKISSGRFFLRYMNSKCTSQHVGINTLSKIPSKVAAFLKLPNPETYTGHSLRRSSATLLANAGGDIVTLKRHGGWRSSTVVQGYIEESESSKIDIAKKIQGNSNNIEGTSSRCENFEASSSSGNVVKETNDFSINVLKNIQSAVNVNATNESLFTSPNSFKFDFNVNINVNK